MNIDRSRGLVTRRQLLQGAAAMAFAGSPLVSGCLPSLRPEKPGQVTLNYMAWGNFEQLAVEQQICDAFEKAHPDVRVHLFMVPGSAYTDKLQLMLASRTAPDVMRVDHYYFPALVRKDYFLPLDPFIAHEKPGFLDDFVPTALDECRYKSGLFAMNVLFGPTVIYYNKNLFKAAGLSEPYELAQKGAWNWDAFVQTAQALTQKEKGTDRIAQFGTSMPPWPGYCSVIWNRGGQLMSDDWSHMVLGDSADGVAAMQDLADLRWKYHCAPTPSDGALSAFAFESGKLAMSWDWSGMSPKYRKSVKKFDWDIAPMPSGPKGDRVVVKGNQIVANALTKHPDLAWEFLKFITGPETEQMVCGTLRRSTPTRKSVQQSAEYLQAELPPYHPKVFLDSVERGRILPINPRYNEWSTEFTSATELLFNLQSESAEATAKNATARVNRLLARPEGF